MEAGDFSIPVTVSSVKFEGIVHTSESLLSRHSLDLFNLEPGTPFGHVAQLSHDVAARLHRLGIFKHVDVVLDSSEKGLVSVVFNVKEVSRLFAKTGTEVGNNEGSMFTSLKIRNALGNAETLEANVSYGVETNTPIYENSAFKSQLGNSFNVALSKPIDADPDKLFVLSAFKHNKSMNLYSSYSQQDSGLSAKYKTIDHVVGALHELTYEACWRRLFDLGSAASMTVRKDAGHSLKSAVSYLGTLDRRDDDLLPSRGYYLKGLLEGAGLGGDVRHVKTDVEGQVHFPLGFGFSIASSLRSGLLWTFGPNQSRVNDRFLLGGPSSVRGFLHNGVGPKDGSDVVGGDMFTSAGISLFTPLPFLSNYPIKGHLFANAGNMVKFDNDRDLSAASKKLFGAFSTAVGLGLAVRFSILRLEINYCLPISVTSTDSVKPGLQFGVGLHFS
ncbi:surface antigen-domain-containing protein [Obelidium mucronatum]|nr:surface antigen-domain-containing protein [Obelidium mucronatum]